MARLFRPSLAIGVDIDGHLIGAARKNLRLAADHTNKLAAQFPASFVYNFGPISVPNPRPSTSASDEFPHNVLFKQENYVLEDDDAVNKVGQFATEQQ